MLNPDEIVTLLEASDALAALQAKQSEVEREQFLDEAYSAIVQMQRAIKDKPIIMGIAAAAYVLHLLLEEVEKRRRRGSSPVRTEGER